jgi:hypothetical protein
MGCSTHWISRERFIGGRILNNFGIWRDAFRSRAATRMAVPDSYGV